MWVRQVVAVDQTLIQEKAATVQVAAVAGSAVPLVLQTLPVAPATGLKEMMEVLAIAAPQQANKMQAAVAARALPEPPQLRLLVGLVAPVRHLL